MGRVTASFGVHYIAVAPAEENVSRDVLDLDDGNVKAKGVRQQEPLRRLRILDYYCI